MFSFPTTVQTTDGEVFESENEIRFTNALVQKYKHVSFVINNTIVEKDAVAVRSHDASKSMSLSIPQRWVNVQKEIQLQIDTASDGCDIMCVASIHVHRTEKPPKLDVFIMKGTLESPETHWAEMPNLQYFGKNNKHTFKAELALIFSTGNSHAFPSDFFIKQFGLVIETLNKHS